MINPGKTPKNKGLMLYWKKILKLITIVNSELNNGKIAKLGSVKFNI